MRLRNLLVLIAAPLWLAAASSEPPAPSAIVCHLGDDATVRPTVTDSPRPLKLFDRLVPGAEVTTGTADVTIAFFDGRRWLVEPESRVAITSEGPEVGEGRVRELTPVPSLIELAPVLTTPRSKQQAAAARIRHAELLDGSAPRLYPSHNAALSRADAVLTFPAGSKAEMYRVTIEKASGDPVLEVTTREPRVTVPANILEPAESYYWRLDAVRDPAREGASVRVGDAIFRTLPDAHEQARRALAQQAGSSEDPALSLLLIEVDLRLGLRREACEELAEISRLEPDLSSLRTVLDSADCQLPGARGEPERRA